jgi:PAS domain S-box-containing protein
VLVIGHDITDSRKMEIKFRGLVESSPDATVFINQQGNIVLINSQAEKLFGYDRQELEARQVEMLIPSRCEEFHSMHWAGFAASPKVRGMGAGLELCGRKKDGREFPVEISLSPIETEEGLWISCSIRDISSRKKAEEEIKKVNLQLTEAQRLAHIGSWEWDVVTNVLSWSDEMFRIFGTTSEKFDLSFDNFINAIHAEDRKSVMDNVQISIKKHEPFDICYRIVRPDGQMRILQRRGEVLVNDLGAAIKLKGTTQDVTEMKQAEALLRAKTEELVVLNYSLHASNRELQRMNADLTTFAYVASHDLQEPLRKIQTFAARILDSEMMNLSETGKDYLHRMHKSVHRVHVLLEDLLTYSRLNTTDKVFEPTDLNKIMEEEKEELTELLQEKKATIDSVTLPHIQAIPFQMRQLFHNLLINSLKFSDPHRNPHIQIRSFNTDNTAIPGSEFSKAREYHCISFSDNGIGFEPRFNERIFEVFQRLQVNQNYPGTGIGLAICKKIAENHGGMIIAQGEPDQGATFHVYLPANNI